MELQLAIATSQWLVVARRANARQAVRALGVLGLAGACFPYAQTAFEGKTAVVIGCMGPAALAFVVAPLTRSYSAFAHYRIYVGGFVFERRDPRKPQRGDETGSPIDATPALDNGTP